MLMSIIKNDIPILEYDTDKSAVIMPKHEHLGLKLPKKAVFAFLRIWISMMNATGAKILLRTH